MAELETFLLGNEPIEKAVKIISESSLRFGFKLSDLNNFFTDKTFESHTVILLLPKIVHL